MPSHNTSAGAEVANLPTLPSYSTPSQPPAYAARSPLTSPPLPTVPQNTPTKSLWGAATSVVSQGPILWRAKDSKQGTTEEETTVWNGNAAAADKKQSIWSSKGTSQSASLWGDRLRGDRNVWGQNV